MQVYKAKGNSFLTLKVSPLLKGIHVQAKLFCCSITKRYGVVAVIVRQKIFIFYLLRFILFCFLFGGFIKNIGWYGDETFDTIDSVARRSRITSLVFLKFLWWM